MNDRPNLSPFHLPCSGSLTLPFLNVSFGGSEVHMRRVPIASIQLPDAKRIYKTYPSSHREIFRKSQVLKLTLPIFFFRKKIHRFSHPSLRQMASGSCSMERRSWVLAVHFGVPTNGLSYSCVGPDMFYSRMAAKSRKW